MAVKGRNKNRKMTIYSSVVRSVLMHGAETWSLYADGRKRMDGTERDALRRSARISRLDRKMNECIREEMNAPDTILYETAGKQLIWCGYVERICVSGSLSPRHGASSGCG